MWFHSLLASWKSGLSGSLRPQPARQGSFRPCLEALEDRCVPSTLNVTSNLDNGASGTLRWAVGVADASTTPNTIDLLTTQPIVLTQGQLLLSANMTVEATAGTATISGDHLSRVFEVGAGTVVTLNALNITSGNAGDGGGIWNDGSTLTVTHCTLSGNTASYGGAIYSTGLRSLTVTYSTLSDNSAGNNGGAIYSTGQGFLAVEDCTLSGNSAKLGVGGAIYDVSPMPNSWIAFDDFSGNTPASLGSPNSYTVFYGEGDTGLPAGAVVVETYGGG
jgi:predicted outer membrane repeat protein